MIDLSSTDAALLFSVLTTVASGLVLLLVWRTDPNEDAVAYWGSGLLLSTLLLPLNRYVAADAAVLPYVRDVVYVVTAGLLVFGTIRFLRWPVSSRIVVIAGLVLWAFLVWLRLATAPHWSRTVTGLLLLAALLAVAGGFHQAWYRTRNRYYGAIATALYVWAGIRVLGIGILGNTATTGVLVSLGISAAKLTIAILFRLLAHDRLVKRLYGQMEERERAEVMARENQRRFEDLVDLSSDWVWETDADFRFTYMSPNIQSLAGRPVEFYIGKSTDEVHAVKTPDSGWIEVGEHLRAHQPFRDLRMRSIHGTTGKAVHFDLSGRPILDAAGRFLGFRGIGRDVTAEVVSRSALDAILGSVANTVGVDYFEALVAHLAQTLKMDVVIVAAHGDGGARLRTLAKWSDGSLVEKSEFEVGRTPCARLLAGELCEYPANVAASFPADAWLREQRIEGFVGTALCDDGGQPIGVLVVSSRAPILNLDTVRTVLRALAPRAAAELQRQLADEQMREAERLFRSVIDNMPAAIVVKVGPRYCVANRTFADWVAIPREQIEGMTEAELYRRMGWGDAHWSGMNTDRNWVLSAAQPIASERKVRYPNGREYDLLVSTFPIPGAAGEVAAVGMVMTNVTELRRAESHLQKSQKMEALGRLAGGVAHDFNNIVGAIAGFARFIVEDTPQSSRSHQHAERILMASMRAKQLIQQILAFSRRTDVRPQSVSVRHTVEETIGLLKATLAASTRIEFERESPEATVKGDPTQLAQVLLNICVNASDALGGKPGRIGISVARQTGAAAAEELKQAASVAERPDGPRAVAGTVDPALDYVMLRVADTGSGMTRDVLDRIFEPFFSTKPPGHGTGLGLAVVHGIVLSHGGAIAVTSRPGVGTVFQIWLPEAAERRIVARRAVGAPASADRGRILVVDDDADFGDMVATSMERLGYEVAVASRPGDAVQAIEKDPMAWDLVITDQTMPGLTGLDVIQRIKQRRPDLPCILCTGYGRDVTEAGARAAGANAFVVKPVDPVVLGQTVAQLIGRP